MATDYYQEPINWSQISSVVVTSPEKMAEGLIYKNEKIFFYDTCSFRGHANLGKSDAEYLINYIKKVNGIIVITRCVLMELASKSGILNKEYVEYLHFVTITHGIKVIVMNEEDLFIILGECFNDIKVINEYLCWAVRMIRNPISTITGTLSENEQLHKMLIEGKGLTSSSVYKVFFSAVRDNKTESDNLGEELLAICMHLLSHMPGSEDYKFNVITEDKGARGTISSIFERTKQQYAGKKVVIYSTPKLLQEMIANKTIEDVDVISRILEMGNSGKVSVYALEPDEFTPNKHVYDSSELAGLMVEPNRIDVRF